MKNVWEWVDDNGILPIGCMVSVSVFVLWFLYKIAVGFYHLMDKLIDKI